MSAPRRLGVHVDSERAKVKQHVRESLLPGAPARQAKTALQASSIIGARSPRKSPSMKSVVVTGVSTGIGWGCVKVLIASGFRVFGSVRKQADAERLAKEFGPNFTPLIFDVTDGVAVAKGAKEVEAALG